MVGTLRDTQEGLHSTVAQPDRVDMCVADRSIEKVYAPFYSLDEDLSHAYTITGQKHYRTHTGRSLSR